MIFKHPAGEQVHGQHGNQTCRGFRVIDADMITYQHISKKALDEGDYQQLFSGVSADIGWECPTGPVLEDVEYRAVAIGYSDPTKHGRVIVVPCGSSYILNNDGRVLIEL